MSDDRLYYQCPFCRRNWIDRGARESLVCPGCGAGPEEFAQYILKKGAEVKVLRSKDDG